MASTTNVPFSPPNDAGASREQNQYALLNFKREYKHPDDKEGTQEFQKITFFRLNPNGTYDNGTTLEEMLRVCIERLSDLNKSFSCRENSLAITKIEEALMWLAHRTADRVSRGVEGKHQQ